MKQVNQISDKGAGFDINDALFVLLKRKRLIITMTILGVLAASVVFVCYPPVYQSEAKLLVRYVLERSAVDSVENTSAGGRGSDGVISAETDLLTSWDLAIQVADALDAQRLSGEFGGLQPVTAGMIRGGLEVSARKGSNVIGLSYRHSSPEFANLILGELVTAYLDKHLEVHRSKASSEFVTRRSELHRSRLNQTDQELKALKAKAGILSLAEGTLNLSAALARTETELNAAETEYAEVQARIREFERVLSHQLTPAPKTAKSAKKMTQAPALLQPPAEELERYQALLAQVARLRQSEAELLSKFKSDTRAVRDNREQANAVRNELQMLRAKYPALTETVAIGSQESPVDIVSERARLAASVAKVETLKTHLAELRKRASDLAEFAPLIEQLERKKAADEERYRTSVVALDKAEIDEALDPSKIPNINVVQKPAPAGRVTGERNKLVFAIAGSGLALSIGFALLTGLLLDPSIKTSGELERRLRVPVLLTIPYLTRRNRKWLRGQSHVQADSATATKREAVPVPWDSGHFIRSYCASIRDRLSLYFELHSLTHKPKLVAVTSFSAGAGSSTIAGGLAAALSEAGEGKVLLVDMYGNRPELHPFFEGKPTSSIADTLDAGKQKLGDGENLYFASANGSDQQTEQLAPRTFYSMVPLFKASEFDYVIFDMPPLERTSAALAMAASMDKVLLVIEAEQDRRDIVQRGFQEFVAANADVSLVLNKARMHDARWLAC